MSPPRFASALLVAAIGCSPKPPATPSAVPTTSRPFVEVTPIARELLTKVAGDQKLGSDWWVRLTVVWKPDARIEVTVEKDPPGPTDAVHEADGVRVVVANDQAVYMKGALIDLVEEQKGWAFDVTFPHRTDRDREAANQWLRERSARKS